MIVLGAVVGDRDSGSVQWLRKTPSGNGSMISTVSGRCEGFHVVPLAQNVSLGCNRAGGRPACWREPETCPPRNRHWAARGSSARIRSFGGENAADHGKPYVRSVAIRLPTSVSGIDVVSLEALDTSTDSYRLFLFAAPRPFASMAWLRAAIIQSGYLQSAPQSNPPSHLTRVVGMDAGNDRLLRAPGRFC